MKPPLGLAVDLVSSSLLRESVGPDGTQTASRGIVKRRISPATAFRTFLASAGAPDTAAAAPETTPLIPARSLDAPALVTADTEPPVDTAVAPGSVLPTAAMCAPLLTASLANATAGHTFGARCRIPLDPPDQDSMCAGSPRTIKTTAEQTDKTTHTHTHTRYNP